MAAVWPAYITKVGGYLNSATEGRTYRKTAQKLASEYATAVSSVLTVAPAGINGIQTPAPIEPMVNAIEKCLKDINDSESRPKLNHFTGWATSVSQYWLATVFSPLVPDPLHIASSTGAPGVFIPITNVVTNGGAIAPLKAGLLKAFTHPTSPVPYGIPMATKLQIAFQSHLLTVGGVHTMGVVSGTPVSPIPIPTLPIPWIQLV